MTPKKFQEKYLPRGEQALNTYELAENAIAILAMSENPVDDMVEILKMYAGSLLPKIVPIKEYGSYHLYQAGKHVGRNEVIREIIEDLNMPRKCRK